MTSIFETKKMKDHGKKPAWVAIVLILMTILGTTYPNLKPYIDKVQPVIEKIEVVETKPSNLIVKSDKVECDEETGVCKVKADEPPKLDLPEAVKEYKFVPITTNVDGQYYDVAVMTISGGNITFVETVRTEHGKQWVFTGPPGNYSVKLTSFDPAKGFVSLTGNVKIDGNIPVPVPTPTPTPVPQPTPTPQPNPQPTPNPTPVVPNTDYGFTKLCYDEVLKIPAGDRVKMLEIADNFETASAAIAAGGVKTVNEANGMLATSNKASLNITNGVPPSSPYYSFFISWSNKAVELNKSGKLRNMLSDYQKAYEESSEGIRLALGK